MLTEILKLDFKITNLLTNLLPNNQFLKLFFSFFSLKGSSIFIWLIIIAILVIFEEKRGKKFIIYFLITFLTTSFLVNIVFKNIFQRPRPTELSSVKAKLSLVKVKLSLTTCPKNYSFPSGHAATAFAAAITLAYFDKKRKYFYYLVAILIAYSRIYLYCHYFLDVLIGALVGYAISRLILLIKYTS